MSSCRQHLVIHQLHAERDNPKREPEVGRSGKEEAEQEAIEDTPHDIVLFAPKYLLEEDSVAWEEPLALLNKKPKLRLVVQTVVVRKTISHLKCDKICHK
jgi:hypothetical protein